MLFWNMASQRLAWVKNTLTKLTRKSLYQCIARHLLLYTLNLFNRKSLGELIQHLRMLKLRIKTVPVNQKSLIEIIYKLLNLLINFLCILATLNFLLFFLSFPEKLFVFGVNPYLRYWVFAFEKTNEFSFVLLHCSHAWLHHYIFIQKNSQEIFII